MTTRSPRTGGTRAPEFPAGLDWLNTAHPLRLADLRGKLVILDFWTYGCINCMHVIPDLKRLEAEYADILVVIGVHSAKFRNEGETDNIRQIILRYNLEHPVVNDRDFQIWQSWGARAWPTLVLIDPVGHVVGGHSGEGIYPVFQPKIEQLRAEFEAQGLLDRTPFRPRLEREGLPQTLLAFPSKVLVDAPRQRLIISDTNHHRILLADLHSGAIQQMIGSGAAGLVDGDLAVARFNQPQGCAITPDGQTLYVADTENHALRVVDLGAGQVQTLAGTGEQARAYPPRGGRIPAVELNSPWDVLLAQTQLYVAMAGTHQIWGLDLPSGYLGPFAGNAREGTADARLKNAELAQPSGLAMDDAGNLYFADSEASTIRVAETRAPNGQVRTIAGSGANLFEFGDADGMGRAARFQHALGVAWADGVLYVADTYNSRIRRIDLATGAVSTLAGSTPGWQDGTASTARFYEPGGLDVADGKLYIADTNNHAIRVLELASGMVSTLPLHGIERLHARTRAFTGASHPLPARTVPAGSTRLRLALTLPQGYKLNPDVPSQVHWHTTGAALQVETEQDVADLTSELPVDLQLGQCVISADLTLYYCSRGQEGVCLLEQVRLVLPITVVATGDAPEPLVLSYTVPTPRRLLPELT